MPRHDTASRSQHPPARPVGSAGARRGDAVDATSRHPSQLGSPRHRSWFFWLIQIPLAWLLALRLQLGHFGVFRAAFMS